MLVGGAAMQWLRDGLGLISVRARPRRSRTRRLVGRRRLRPGAHRARLPVLGSGCSGSRHGLTRGTTRAHLVRATLEAIAFQVADVLDAFPGELAALRADGGATRIASSCSSRRTSSAARRDRRGRGGDGLGAAALAGLAWPGTGPDDVRRLIRHDEVYEPCCRVTEAAAAAPEWARRTGAARR